MVLKSPQQKKQTMISGMATENCILQQNKNEADSKRQNACKAWRSTESTQLYFIMLHTAGLRGLNICFPVRVWPWGAFLKLHVQNGRETEGTKHCHGNHHPRDIVGRGTWRNKIFYHQLKNILSWNPHFVVECGKNQTLSISRLCAPVFIFTTGSSALLF